MVQQEHYNLGTFEDKLLSVNNRTLNNKRFYTFNNKVA